MTQIAEDRCETVCSVQRFLTNNAPNDWIGSADWPKGKHELRVHLWSLTYVGLDTTIKVKLELEDPDKLPAYKPHPEDVLVAQQPTSLFELLQPQGEEQVDSDFDDGEGEEGEAEEEGEGDGDGDEEGEDVDAPEALEGTVM